MCSSPSPYAYFCQAGRQAFIDLLLPLTHPTALPTSSLPPVECLCLSFSSGEGMTEAVRRTKTLSEYPEGHVSPPSCALFYLRVPGKQLMSPLSLFALAHIYTAPTRRCPLLCSLCVGVPRAGGDRGSHPPFFPELSTQPSSWNLKVSVALQRM